ncbi:MAG: DUF4340 domain-containing protein, partial [Cyanobacteria bacterium]|nr:DUF4340 domain-containing protein [Cyanobacteriota bacterium]MDW8202866.1 hypothetical protein [Cyanobacteriota bacterium SKYGB_h_bin112]
TLTVPTSQLAELGLDPPIARVELTLKKGDVQRLVVGKPDFSNRFLYARVNPSSQPASQVEVILIPIDLQSAIDRPLDDWKQASEASPSSASETTTAPTSPAPAAASPSPAPKPQPATDSKPSDSTPSNP